MEENTDFPGADLSQKTGLDLNGCQKACQDDVKCNYLTYQKSTKKCWLKSEKPKVVKGNKDLVSGPKMCGKYK